MELRHYQKAAVDAIWNGLAEHNGHILAVLPTGTGKSLVICDFVRRALQGYPETRVQILTFSRELVAQNFSTMMRLWPECPAGIHSAGLNKRDVRSNVIFGSIQSIHNKAEKIQQCDLLLIDEAQSIPRKSDTMWRKYISDLQEINGGKVRVIGLTATAYRMDSGMLHKGKDALFSDIVYEYNLLDAINDGYLARPVSVASNVTIDTTGVGTRAGDFIPSALEAAAINPQVVDAIADEIVLNGKDRRGWIVFACGVSHATMLRDALRARGITCESVFGTTPSAERDSIIRRFKREEIRALVSVNALTTGFDAPHTSLIALARPTKSCGLYVQMVGRGTRLAPGKDDCLVLDFGNCIATHGPVDAPRVKAEKSGDTEKGEMPTKACPSCEARNTIAARECVQCGAPFPPVVQTIQTAASTLGLLSVDQAVPQWIEVDAVTYRLHPPKGPDKPPTLRVTYTTGLNQHNEWVCLQHTGYPRQKAVAWWQKRSPGVPVPSSVAEALEAVHVLPKPRQIAVRPSGRFTEIVGVIL